MVDTRRHYSCSVDSATCCFESSNKSLISAATISNFPVFETSGPSPRKPKVGPEYLLLLHYVQSQLPSVPEGQSLAVFVEPRIESGFPDAVAVYWDVGTASSWFEERAELKKFDVQILHYLSTVETAKTDQLKDLFGSNIAKSLVRLYEAGLVTNDFGSWETSPIDEIFAVRRLIAIEAKMKEWRKGLWQAFHNTWFASESYLLVPHIPKNSALIEEAARLEIGVVEQDQFLDSSKAESRQERIPKSYASWLFNEWAWRAEYAGLEIWEENQ